MVQADARMRFYFLSEWLRAWIDKEYRILVKLSIEFKLNYPNITPDFYPLLYY